MVKALVHDPILLSIKSEPATQEDLQTAKGLLDTLAANKEGCLSLLGGPRKCKRYQAVKVRWQNEQFQTRVKTFTGWSAQIIQHEIDHCNGILI